MKKTILLLAIVFSGIVVVFAFKPSSSIPVKIASVFEDEEIIQQEQQAIGVAYHTWVADGSPSEGMDKSKQENHYCTSTQYFATRSARLDWVVDDMMGGMGNPNHVHFITFEFDADCSRYCPYVCSCWKATVTTWTSNPC